MEFVSTNNFKIRGDMIPNLNAKEYIKAIENQCDIDIATSPRWGDVITRIQAVVIECKRRIKDYKLRNSIIVEKLQKEFAYISPFELSQVLARTARKWERLKIQRRSKFDEVKSEGNVSISSEDTKIKEEEIPELTLFDEADVKEIDDSIMPPLSISAVPSDSINCNLSPVRSNVYKELIRSNVTSGRESENAVNSQFYRRRASIINSSPKTIIISSSKTASEFKLKNCALQIAMIQYQSLTNISKFKSISVLPATPVRLVPGIAYTFKIIFKLTKEQEQNEQDFTSKIKFQVKCPAYALTPPQSYFEYLVPIISIPEKKLKYRSVTVSETIVIPPVYSWQLKYKCTFYEYPFGISEVSVDTKDVHSYYVRIVNRKVDTVSNGASDTSSNEVNITTPLSSVSQNIHNEIKEPIHNAVLSPKVISDPHRANIKSSSPISKETNTVYKKSSITTTLSTLEMVNKVNELVDKIVDRAMDVFVFDKTYLFLKPGETKSVRVYFIQVQRIGCHNCYYDFEFYDYASNELIFTKTTKVFADILPHPIQIMPDALDMRGTPIIFGHCINSFILTNTHYVYPVNIRISTTAAMQNLIKIEPMKTVLLPKKSAKFAVNICSSNWNPFILDVQEYELQDKDHYFVQFTIKILISGHAAVFKNITPLYYDIIAPCIHEFVYGKKKYEFTNM